MGLIPWSPLAYGLLTGKYDRASVDAAAPRPSGLPRDAASPDATRPPDDRRLDGANPFGDTLFTDRNWAIVDALRRVSAQAGESPARVALTWLMGRPNVASTLLGVSRVEQLADNLAALDTTLSSEHRATLDEVSARDRRMLYTLFTPAMRRNAIFGGNDVEPWPI